MQYLSTLILLLSIRAAVLQLEVTEFVNASLAAWEEVERIINGTCGGIGATCTGRNLTSGNDGIVCHCDDHCWKYGDCCVDAAREAFLQGKEPEQHWICQNVPVNSQKSYSIYMIGLCPHNWTDEEVRLNCRKQVNETNYSYLLDIPVVSSTTNITYVNIYCAICNQETDLLDTELKLDCANSSECDNQLSNATYIKGELKWRSKRRRTPVIVSASVTLFDNKTKFLTTTMSRRCERTEVRCQPTDLTDKYFCSAFAYYVYLKGVIAVKNPICSRCNLKSFEIFCKKITYITSISKNKLSFSVLLDFNEIHGKYVGIRKRCHDGNVYDPLSKKCVPLFCGKNFRKINGRCSKNDITKNKDGSTHNEDDLIRMEIINKEVEPLSVPLNSTCSRILIRDSTGLQNKGLYLNEIDNKNERNKIVTFNSSVMFICVDEENQYVDNFSIAQRYLSLIITTISLVCLALHIIVHSSLAKMRNLPGINLLSLSTMLFIAQLLFMGITEVVQTEFCKARAIAMHYAFLASFFWMNVMAIDICRTFTTNHRPCLSDVKISYLKYGAYAWILPAIIVLTAVIIDNISLLPEFRPFYGVHICWITRRRGLLVFFAIPLAILLVENLVLFALTARGIYCTIKATKITNQKNDNVRFFLYLKLAMIMGLTWIFGFIASKTDSTVMWYVFIIFNASQGIYIFIAFTLKRKIYKLIKDQWFSHFGKKSNSKSQQNLSRTLNQAISSSNLDVAM